MTTIENHSSPTAASTPPPGERRHARRAVVVVTVLAVLAAGAGGAVGVARWSAGVDERLAESVAELEVERGALRAARGAAQAELSSASGRVADNGVRAELAALLSASRLPDAAVEGSRQDRTTQNAAAAQRAADSAAALVASTASVREAVAAWELAQAVEAHAAAVSALAGAIDAGEQRLAATQERVQNDVVREQLRAALDAAITVRDGEVDAGVLDDLVVAARVAYEARAAVEGSVAAVDAAEVAWQEEAARQAVVPDTSPRGTGGGSNASPPKAGGSGTQARGGSAPGKKGGGSGAQGQGSGGGHWVEVEGDPWESCGWVDQHNNTGTC